MDIWMSREGLGRMLHDLFCEDTKTYARWEKLSPAEQESACRVAEAFCFNAQWPSQRPRTFHARVALMGHRSLGLCRVTEAPLAGVTMLRCEKDGTVEWVNPAAVYSVVEVSDEVAAEEIAKATQRAELLRAEAEQDAARLRTEREAATVDVVVDCENKATGVIASVPRLLQRGDPALTAALAAHGIVNYAMGALSDDAYETVGFVIHNVEGVSVRLGDAMRDLGFSAVTVRDAVDDELIADIPF